MFLLIYLNNYFIIWIINLANLLNLYNGLFLCWWWISIAGFIRIIRKILRRKLHVNLFRLALFFSPSFFSLDHIREHWALFHQLAEQMCGSVWHDDLLDHDGDCCPRKKGYLKQFSWWCFRFCLKKASVLRHAHQKCRK